MINHVSEIYHLLGGDGAMIIGSTLKNPCLALSSGGAGTGLSGDGIEGGVADSASRNS